MLLVLSLIQIDEVAGHKPDLALLIEEQWLNELEVNFIFPDQNEAENDFKQLVHRVVIQLRDHLLSNCRLWKLNLGFDIDNVG